MNLPQDQTLPQLGALAAALTPPASEPLPGARVGPYRLVCRIGRGGMGDVFSAERADQLYRRTVALKFMRTHLGCRGPEVAARFEASGEFLPR